jgi:hypothetical protein
MKMNLYLLNCSIAVTNMHAWLPGEPGLSRAVSDGYWVILEPLPPGKHEINFNASLTDPKTGILLYSDVLKYIANVG